ncbi:MAG: HAMP domain-containing histidine kinase [Planctomycetes bacterium]|nr:HAMP domain-containing histidine kinase [Planctomycetota bacterium]
MAAQQARVAPRGTAPESAADRCCGVDGDALAVVLHDLNNAVGAIAGFVLLLRNVAGRVDKVSRYATFIAAASWEAGYLVAQLEDLAAAPRPGDGLGDGAISIAAAGAVADLSGVLRRSVEGEQERAAAYGRAIRLDLPASLPAARGDAGALATVTTDLLVSATRHAPSGSTVVVSAAREDSRVAVRFAAPGPLLPDDCLPLLFRREHVRQVRRRGMRLGLGLSLVRAASLAESNGWRVAAHSPVPGRADGVLLEVALPA